MNPKHMETGLTLLSSRLSPYVEMTAIRGSGSAQFLYVSGGARSVEVSFDQNNAVWVEFWSDSKDETASAACEETFVNIEHAEKSIRDWLKGAGP